MTADMLSNKILNLTVTWLFITGKKLNISLIFITQPYSALPKNNILNFTHLFVMEIPNKRELQQTAYNHLSGMDFKDLSNLYKICTTKPYSILFSYWCYSCIR